MYHHNLLRTLKYIPRVKFLALINFSIYLITKNLIYLFKIKKPLNHPISLYVWITNRCQKSCGFCPYVQTLDREDNNRENDLSFEEFKEIIDSPLASKSIHIALYGGEPLLNKDFSKMSLYAKSRGHLVSLTTNGLLLKNNFNILEHATLDVISISYYPEDKEELLRNLIFLPKAPYKKLNFILSKSRLKFLRSALEIASRFNFDELTIDTISTRNTDHRNAIAQNDPEWHQVMNIIDTFRQKSRVAIKLPLFERNKGSVNSCRFMWNTLYVDKNSVAPCCEWQKNDYTPYRTTAAIRHLFNKERIALLDKTNLHKRCEGCIYREDRAMGIL